MYLWSCNLLRDLSNTKLHLLWLMHINLNHFVVFMCMYLATVCAYLCMIALKYERHQIIAVLNTYFPCRMRPRDVVHSSTIHNLYVWFSKHLFDNISTFGHCFAVMVVLNIVVMIFAIIMV